MKPKHGSLSLVLIILLVIGIVAGSVAVVISHPGLLKLGLDLQGGVSVTLQAQPEDGQKVTSDDMNNLCDIMTKRVDEFGVAEPLIQVEGDDRIIVELAGLTDINEAVEMLGTTAKLQFIDPQGNVILDGNDLKLRTARITRMKLLWNLPAQAKRLLLMPPQNL